MAGIAGGQFFPSLRAGGFLLSVSDANNTLGKHTIWSVHIFRAFEGEMYTKYPFKKLKINLILKNFFLNVHGIIMNQK